jgi:hypothetical protein
VSSRRESSVGAARRPSHPPSRRPATRKGGALAVRCPGLYALGGERNGTRDGAPRRPGGGPGRAYDVFLLAFHDRLIVVGVLYTMQPDRRFGLRPGAEPHRPCISRAPTPHKTQLTCPPSRSVRRNRRARHRTPRIENGHMGCMRPHITSPHMRPRTRPSPTAHTASHIMLIITGTKR